MSYSIRPTRCALLHAIVRRFLRDDHVVHMALAQSRRGDSNEPALLAEFFQSGRSHVAHAALQSADELVRQRAQRSFVGHAPLDAFRTRLAALPAFLRLTARR